MGPNTVKIRTTAFLSYLLLTAGQLSLKRYLLLTCQILGLFATILAANDKYPVLNRVNLTIPGEMQLSQKQKIFSRFFMFIFEL